MSERMSDETELSAANDKIAELEAQVRVMRGIIVQAMLQNNREVEQMAYKNQMPYTTTTSAVSYPGAQYGISPQSPNYVAQKQWIQQAMEEATKPLTVFSKFTEPQA